MANHRCPCGQPRHLKQCCLLYINGEALPVTAEALMRSRYTAYTLKRWDYLKESWAPDYCPDNIEQHDRQLRWLGLTITATTAGQATDDNGTVTFIAELREKGQRHTLREESQFIKRDGRWYYQQGKSTVTPYHPNKK
ncbi:MAG: hypothetical protein HQL49_01595 [Gammaproteobacteria bacterium]|nr:hypothetical protein [Gammaproteobacteria bacterium]